MKNLNIAAILFSILILCVTNYAWLDYSSNEEFNFPLFFIILTFSYIIYSKFFIIIDILKKNNPTNTIFIITIFCMLFLPISIINHDSISDSEERFLAKFPKLLEDNHFNYKFGHEFENWFNDRFFGRNQIIQLYNNLKVICSGDLVKFPTIHFYKSNGWMLANQDFHGYKKYTNNQLNIISTNIRQLKEFCNKNNIKLYIMVVPSKEILYKDMDLMRLPKKSTKQNKVKTLVEKIYKDLNYEILYPEEELLTLKKENKFVFFKTDTHPTDEAAYELYKIFIKQISKNFPDIHITPLSEYKKSTNNLVRAGSSADLYEEGTYYRLAYINYQKLLNTKYTYYNYKHPENIDIVEDGLHQTYTNKNGKYKLFILGDSFQENMSRFLSTNFYQIDKWRGNFKEMAPIRESNLDMNVFESIILDFKPDILFIILHQDNADWFFELYPDKRRK